MEGLDFASRRSAVYGSAGMVATSQPLAVQAGLRVLERGGNAADAAVAAAAVLAVTEPTGCGLGGDCFALYYEARTQKISALNGSGRSPAALTLDALAARGLRELPAFDALTITVPGVVAGWFSLVERFGTMAVADLIDPAAALAWRGFPVTSITAHFWEIAARLQLAKAANGHELLIGDRAPRTGELFRNPNLAATLEQIAAEGRDGFYRGRVATAIERVVAQCGGVLTAGDLAAHESTWSDPISVRYRDRVIYECPPNGQGLVALIALGLLDQLDDLGVPLSPRRLHCTIEALRLAFADGQQYIADPAATAVPVAGLLDPAYLAERARHIYNDRAAADVTAGSPRSSSDTVYLSVIDAAGNACSFIQSNYMGFGTGIVPAGCGFTLQNRGHNFSLDPEHPNGLGPAKRPYHTIIPAMATREDGSLYASFGVMGGFMQPQGHVQVLLALVDDRVDPQSALDRPRLCIEPRDGSVAVEAGTPTATRDALAKLGHNVREVSGHARALFGRGQIITRERDGVLGGGSDPRADGCAAPVFG